MSYHLSEMRISFVAGTLGQGGAERQLYYILQALRAQGAQVNLLSLSRGEFWEEPIRALGVPIIWVGKHSFPLWRLLEIVAQCRHHLPHVIQGQHFYTNVYAASAARLLGVHAIGAVRNDGAYDIRSVGRLGGYVSLHMPHLLAANSRAALRHLSSVGKPSHGLAYLPNVVDTDLFQPSAKDDTDTVTILSIGRLVPAKRFDRLLRVLKELIECCRVPIRARIVGNGPELPKLQALAQSLGLSGHVEFCSASADVVQFYTDADLFVLVSDWEGTPNVLMEAMSSGLPVVATRVGGVPDLIKEGETGFLVATEDTEGLVEAIQRLIQDRPLRRTMGAAARSYVLQNHALVRLPSYLAGLYTQALAEEVVV